VLALILSVGNLFGWAVQMNLHLYVAALPAAAIIYFAFTEQVQQITPPKPSHHPAAYHQALENYREARTTYLRSYRWFGLTFAGFVIVFFGISATRLSDVFRGVVMLIGFAVLVLSSVFLAIRQRRWLLWPCPRCGSSFRGHWPTPWMPKKCAYCGLPKETFQVARWRTGASADVSFPDNALLSFLRKCPPSDRFLSLSCKITMAVFTPKGAERQGDAKPDRTIF
jgi:hypothetical protein